MRVVAFVVTCLLPLVLSRSDSYVYATVQAHRKHRSQRPLKTGVVCESVVGDGVGMSCHFFNVCVHFGSQITLKLPQQAATVARLPKSVFLNTRPKSSTDQNHEYVRARVALVDSLYKDTSSFDPGHHVLMHSTCWNYGHWLYDTIIPLHRLTRASNANNVTAVDVNSQDCGTYHDSTFGLSLTFANGTSLVTTNATQCFSSLMAGFSPDWGLEVQYNPVLYSGPSMDQYQSFRDALYTDNSPTAKKRILVSKRNGPRRIINIAAFASELAHRLGSEWTIQVVDFANATIADQIDTIRSASAMIGLSGSNVLNSVFARNGFRVFEVLPVRMHDFHTDTFKRMPYICHVAHRAADNETTFLDENVAWIDKVDFAEQYHVPENWRNPQSSRLWHSSASITLDVDRFWQAVHAKLTAPCQSTTYTLFYGSDGL